MIGWLPAGRIIVHPGHPDPPAEPGIEKALARFRSGVGQPRLWRLRIAQICAIMDGAVMRQSAAHSGG